jgi:hypothetical protein
VRPAATLLAGIAIVALVSTLGDLAWYTLGVEHRMTAGIIHGVVLLTAVGGVLGASAGRFAAGLPLGMAAGVGGALAYYALVPVVGQAAMIVAWAALWVLLAWFDEVLLRRSRHAPGKRLMRGGLAAVLGGLAFYLVVGTLWGRPPEGGRNYLIQLAAWAFAWAPGLIVLTWPRAGAAPGSPTD